MSNTQNTIWIESAWTDFLAFLGAKDYTNAKALIDSVGENGFENDALKMHKMINSAIAEDEGTCEWCEIDYLGKHERNCLIRQEDYADSIKHDN